MKKIWIIKVLLLHIQWCLCSLTPEFIFWRGKVPVLTLNETCTYQYDFVKLQPVEKPVMVQNAIYTVETFFKRFYGRVWNPSSLQMCKWKYIIKSTVSKSFNSKYLFYFILEQKNMNVFGHYWASQKSMSCIWGLTPQPKSSLYWLSFRPCCSVGKLIETGS